METKWLEDFVSLAETHSFSRSAQLQDVIQAFFQGFKSTSQNGFAEHFLH